MTELRSERLVLRAARSEDLGPIHAIYANAEAMRYWDSPAHRTLEDTRGLHERLMRPGPRRYFVWDCDGQVIGTGGFHAEAELGFILHPDHWRKGFAREACSTLIAHIWGTTDVSKIVAEADPRNLASVGLLTRLGFRVTGFVRDAIFHNGEWTDSVYFALPRREPIA